jgi:hypothetical protein
MLAGGAGIALEFSGSGGGGGVGVGWQLWGIEFRNCDDGAATEEKMCRGGWASYTEGSVGVA